MRRTILCYAPWHIQPKIAKGESLDMAKQLPLKLQKEPLAEAVCELRIGGVVPLHNIVPGILLSQPSGHVRDVVQLPAASIPEPVRAADPNMTHLPLIRLKWRDLTVLVGSRVLTISHVPPYLGWAGFKPMITELFSTVLRSGVAPSVERYSLKYQNLFKSTEEPKPETILDMSLKIGDLSLKSRSAYVRVEVVDEDLVTIVQIAESATMQVEGKAPIQGLLVDVDTVSTGPALTSGEFLNQLDAKLDRARLVNKAVFFECLREEAVKALGPTYAD